MKSSLPLLQHLGHETNVIFTTATLSSQDILRSWLRVRVLNEGTTLALASVDVPNAVSRYLDWWMPDSVIIFESEIWPNLLYYLHRRLILVVLLNARLSGQSYSRWRYSLGIFRLIVGMFDGIQARSLLDCARFHLLAGGNNLTFSADLKFLAEPLPFDQLEVQYMAPCFIGRPVWLSASTHPGEEEIVLTAHKALKAKFPELLSIVVPRHPERGPRLGADLQSTRRAAGMRPPVQGMWIADTYGELGVWFRLIPIVFLGKSLVPKGGGQNVFEPARLACALAVGLEMSNFMEHMNLLRTANAVTEVAGDSQLVEFVELMLSAPHHRRRVGERAAKAVPELIERVDNYLGEATRSTLRSR